MSAIILPDKWRRQPSGPVAIAPEWRSGALSVWTPGQGTGIEHTQRIAGVNSGLARAPTVKGLSLVADATNSAYAAKRSGYSDGWITILALVNNTSGAQRNTVFYGLSSTASNNPLLTIGTDSTTNAVNLYVRNDANSGGLMAASLDTFPTGDFALIGARFQLGVSLIDYFTNGRLVSSRTTTSPPTGQATFDRVSIGALVRASVALHATGQIALGAAWNAYVSDAQMADLAVNPWQVFRKSPRILYFTAGGGGATDIAGSLESISLSTFGATVGSARDIAGALESLSLTPYAATVGSARAITAAVESISLGTYAATVSRDTAIAGGLESIALTANAASVTLGAAIAAALEAIVLQANPAAVALDAAIAAQLEQITITGLGATVSTSSDVNIGAALESITLSVPQALVSSDRDIAGGLESISITAHGATVTLGALIQAALESIALQSFGAGITLNVSLTGGLEQINLTTLAAQIGLGSNVAALVEAITLTEFGATLTMTGEIAAALESIGLTTFAATVVGGESALTTPGLEFTIPVGRMHYAIPIGRIHFTIPRD